MYSRVFKKSFINSLSKLAIKSTEIGEKLIWLCPFFEDIMTLVVSKSYSSGKVFVCGIP